MSALRKISIARWLKLVGGLACFGVGVAFMKQADLGLGPWDVLSDGLSQRTGLQLGTLTIIIGAAVLLLWLPLREKPGIGTVSNMLLIGTFTNIGLSFIGRAGALWVRGVWMVIGLWLIGLGSALYLNSDLGAGPRDGLMMGICRKTGWSVRLTRTLLEVAALVLGWLLGGSVGIGTVAFALGIGPILQFLLQLLEGPRTEARGEICVSSE